MDRSDAFRELEGIVLTAGFMVGGPLEGKSWESYDRDEIEGFLRDSIGYLKKISDVLHRAKDLPALECPLDVMVRIDDVEVLPWEGLWYFRETAHWLEINGKAYRKEGFVDHEDGVAFRQRKV